MATKKHPRQSKGRLAIIEQVERALLGEPEPDEPWVEEAVLGKRPPKLKREKDGSLTCPTHSNSYFVHRRYRGNKGLRGGKLVAYRTSEIVYVGLQPYCAKCWEIVEGSCPGGNLHWKFVRMRFPERKRAFLMHRTRAAREQPYDSD